MTYAEAKEYRSRMSEDLLVSIVREHDELKHALCERAMGIPTGSADWLDRAMIRADQLTNCEGQLRVLVGTVQTACDEANERTRVRDCYNCRGTKIVAGESCVVCRGTGRSRR